MSLQKAKYITTDLYDDTTIRISVDSKHCSEFGPGPGSSPWRVVDVCTVVVAGTRKSHFGSLCFSARRNSEYDNPFWQESI